MTVCLDSWAVLRWLNGVEPAFSRVEAELADRPVMSWINLGEVYYVVWRAEGPDKADEVVGALRAGLDLDTPTPERTLAAALVKARQPMAYADAFAVATAEARRVPLFTGDPEIIDADLPIEVVDLR